MNEFYELTNNIIKEIKEYFENEQLYIRFIYNGSDWFIVFTDWIFEYKQLEDALTEFTKNNVDKRNRTNNK